MYRGRKVGEHVRYKDALTVAVLNAALRIVPAFGSGDGDRDFDLRLDRLSRGGRGRRR